MTKQISKEHGLIYWCKTADEVIAFYKKSNRTPYPKEENGIWVSNQRQFYKNGTLSDERYNYLIKNIPIFFKSRAETDEENWYKIANEVIVFFKKYERLPNYKEINGDWINTQKQNLKNEKLSKEKEEFLTNKIPRYYFVNVLIKNWYTVADEVIKFYKQNERLPYLSEKNGIWVNNQRQSEKNKKISIEKYNYLIKNIPDFFLPREEQWYKTADEVIESKFKKNLTKTQTQWIANRRTEYQTKNKKLTPEKIKYILEKDKDFFKTIFSRQTL